METKIFSLTLILTVMMNNNVKSSETFTNSTKSFDIELKEINDLHLIYYEYRGPYESAFNEFGRFMGYIQSNNIPLGPHSLGIFYDDPLRVPAEELRSEVGYLVQEKVQCSGPYKYKKIEGGKAVAVKYTTMEDIMPAYEALGKYIAEKNIKTVEYSIEMYYSHDESTVDAEIIMFLDE